MLPFGSISRESKKRFLGVRASRSLVYLSHIKYGNIGIILEWERPARDDISRAGRSHCTPKIIIIPTKTETISYQFHKIALDITPPTPPRVRGGSDFIGTSLEKWYHFELSQRILLQN